MKEQIPINELINLFGGSRPGQPDLDFDDTLGESALRANPDLDTTIGPDGKSQAMESVFTEATDSDTILNLFTNLILLMCIIGFSMITNFFISEFIYNDYSDSSFSKTPDEDNPEGFIAYVKRKYWFNSAFLNTISLIITTLYVKFFLWLLTRRKKDKRLSLKWQFGLGMIYTLVLIGYVYYKHIDKKVAEAKEEAAAEAAAAAAAAAATA